MEIRDGVDVQVLDSDQVGAHFKFADICNRLDTVVQNRLQLKRSQDLLSYQASNSVNDQSPSKIPVK